MARRFLVFCSAAREIRLFLSSSEVSNLCICKITRADCEQFWMVLCIYSVSPFLMTCEHQWREHWLKRAKYQNVRFFWTLETVFAFCSTPRSRHMRMLCFNVHLETFHMKKRKGWSIFHWALCRWMRQEQCLIVFMPHTRSYSTLLKTLFQAVTRYTFLERSIWWCLKLCGAFPPMPEQLFLWFPVLPLPFLPEKHKHKYYKLILLATVETNVLRGADCFYLYVC